MTQEYGEREGAGGAAAQAIFLSRLSRIGRSRSDPQLLSLCKSIMVCETITDGLRLTIPDGNHRRSRR